MKTMKRWSWLLVSSVFTLAGCGDDDGKAGGGSSGSGGVAGGSAGSAGASAGAAGAAGSGMAGAGAAGMSGAAGMDGGACVADPGSNSTAIDIEGTYDDGFDGTVVIETDSMTLSSMFGTSTFAVLSVDNVAMFFVAQNDCGNEFSAGLYSRFDWAVVMGDVWQCQTVFDAATQAAAEATPRADDSDPANAGCGGFAWTKLTPK